MSSGSESDDFPIKEDDVLDSSYVVQEFIGQGGFGKVARCRDKRTHRDVAIKISKNKAEISKQAKREVAILKLLDALDPERSNIVRWSGSFVHADLLCIKFELLHQSLYNFMCERRFQPLPVPDLRAVVQQTTNALLHLEALGVIHCDVKPANIMVVDSIQRPLKVKLIDFGLAQHISEPPSFGGTLCYQAPEVFLGLFYTEEVDMWSLGVSMAELALGVHPYPGDHPYDMMKYIVDTQGLPPDFLLRAGSETKSYFRRRWLDGTWTLKTPARVQKQTGHTFCDSRHVKFNSLDDIQHMMDTSTSEKDGRDFVDLLKGMLHLHKFKRLKPADVLKHPFLEDNRADAAPRQVLAEDHPVLTEDGVSTSQEEAEAAAIQPDVPTESRRTWKRRVTRVFRRLFCLRSHRESDSVKTAASVCVSSSVYLTCPSHYDL